MREGWQTGRLGDACEIYQPKTISKKQMKPDGLYPVFGANGVIGRYDEFNHEDPQLLVTCRGATCGSVNISLPKSWITGNAMVIRPIIDGLDQRFLEYFFRGALDFSKVISGAAQPQITRQSLSPVEIAWPHIPEQKRIVAILDETFAGIDAVIASTEKNLANSWEIFESYLNSIFAKKRDDWCETTLGEAYDVRDGTHDSPKYQAEGRALITSKNLKREGLTFQKVKFISEQDYINICKRSAVHKGDVLFAMIGTIGNPIVVEVEPDFAIKNVALLKVGENRSGLFLKYYLQSRAVVEKMMAEAKGTTQRFVGLGYLRSFPISLPDAESEKAIVNTINEYERRAKELEVVYMKKLSALSELKQSMLAKAFSGELTAQPNSAPQEAVA